MPPDRLMYLGDTCLQTIRVGSNVSRQVGVGEEKVEVRSWWCVKCNVGAGKIVSPRATCSLAPSSLFHEVPLKLDVKNEPHLVQVCFWSA